MLALGMLAWVARYALFAMGAPEQMRWMILVGILLHGICYDFFFVTGQIYTDRIAPRHLRGQAQGLLVLFTLGLGMFIGAQVAGKVEALYTTKESKAFAIQIMDLQDQARAMESSIKDGKGDPDAASRLTEIRESRIPALRKSELQAIDWRPLWGLPALFAGGVLLVFVLLFKQPAAKSESL